MKNWTKLLPAFIAVYLGGCDSHQSPTQPSESTQPLAKLASSQNIFVARHREKIIFQIEALKWRDGHRGAVSITYDAPWGIDRVFSLATDAALARGLHMDIEIVSSKLEHPMRFPIVTRMREELLPRGIHFYGHGHEHVHPDWLDRDQAYASFKLNFDLMKRWGLNPKAYAYPGWAGEKTHVQMANERVGFICARGGTNDPEGYYICPREVSEPDNWYYLPSVKMGTEGKGHVSDHRTLEPFLHRTLDLGAWVILTYHSIGYPEGWGYYPYEEYLRDLNFIAREDFWSGNLDAVAAYIQERNALDINIVRYFGSETPRSYDIIISDQLNNALFNEPLTLDFTFNPQLNVQKVYIDPPVEKRTVFPVVDNKMRLHVVPNERRYTLVLED